jgi:hypothetical protein
MKVLEIMNQYFKNYCFSWLELFIVILGEKKTSVRRPSIERRQSLENSIWQLDWPIVFRVAKTGWYSGRNFWVQNFVFKTFLDEFEKRRFSLIYA